MEQYSAIAASIDPGMIEDFKIGLKGELILPVDPSYNEARKVYNGMIDKKPGMIVICNDVADVIHCVKFARDNSMLTSVRGGGHNAGGLGICDGGMVIDLSGIKYVRVDPEAKTIRVGGGNTWGEVDHASHAFGLATPAGIISTTGVGGLTLGGGVGHLSRKYGLTIDNLLEADMVLADGSFVTVSEKKNSDLFWAIRGGGGNFGIVTSFLFRAHEVHTVYGGPVFWEIEKTPEVLKWYHEFIHNAPEELNGFFATLEVPVPPFPDFLKGKKVCGIVWCYCGDLDKAEEVFRPILEFNEPVFQYVGPMPYPAIQSLFDPLMPAGMQWYWRADFFNEINGELGPIHQQFGSAIPTPLSQMHLYPVSGKASRRDDSEMPWAYRDAKYAGVIVGVDPDPENAGTITEWCKGYFDATHPHSMKGAYSNFMMEEGRERVKASFRHNYERLVEIKRKYDPTNFFRVNQNIVPG
jgi:FAD/FMN-containing dehydrogenase